MLQVQRADDGCVASVPATCPRCSEEMQLQTISDASSSFRAAGTLDSAPVSTGSKEPESEPGADAGTIDTKPEESNAEEQTLFPIDKRE
ncbi:unnamed protein product [Effrenium voratum]|nr:unnamed protein product [Effrenium voratum]